MKKTIVLTNLLLLTLSGISQIASDSVTCIPNVKLRKVIKQVENCKIIEQELILTQKSVSILQERIFWKDSIIKKYKIEDSLCTKRSENYDLIVSNINNQLSNEKKINFIQGVKVRTLKINKWIYGGAGVFVGIIAKILLSK